MSELLCCSVNAPELVAGLVTGDEGAVLVPAMDPGDTVVELEEACLHSFALVVFDGGCSLSALVIVFKQIAA